MERKELYREVDLLESRVKLLQLESRVLQEALNVHQNKEDFKQLEARVTILEQY